MCPHNHLDCIYKSSGEYKSRYLTLMRIRHFIFGDASAGHISEGFSLNDLADAPGEHADPGKQLFIHKFLKPPFAKLSEPVHDVRRNPVMHSFPGLVNKIHLCQRFIPVEVKSNHDEKLRYFMFTPFLNGGAHIHGKYPDRVTTAACVQKIPGIVEIKRGWRILDPDSIQIGYLERVKAADSLSQGERISRPPEKVDPDIVQLAIHERDFCEMVRPAA